MCDTFVALGSGTSDGSVIFGKNSDRTPNEAQALEYHAPADHAPGDEVRCTWLTIPQVSHTHGVLLSRPHWMWGAEMGANDRGLVIGNEAVFTRLPRTREPGLIGMDLLRLALERAGSAREGVGVITELLDRHGQGGLHSPTRVYHNSYILADPREAWILETAGRHWVASRARQSVSIGNCLTIGEEYDLSSAGLADQAREAGLLRRGQALHFARCFSDSFYTTFSASRARLSRTRELLTAAAGRLDTAGAFAILRDHGEKKDGYRPDRHLLMSRVCAHAANALARDAAQSTGSLVAHLGSGGRTFWATGTSAPCTGVFKPFWFEAPSLPGEPPPGGRFDERCLWWRHEMVHRAALRDLPGALERIRPRRDALERELLDRARTAPDRAPVAREAFRRADELDHDLAEVLRRDLRASFALPPYRAYWDKRNREAGLEL